MIDINLNEKILICHTPCGPTYRESTVDKLTNYYFDHPNLYYSVITDNKEYFKDVKRENLIVNELKDFYNDFPHLEKYEAFLESTDANDYASKVRQLDWKFPFSSMRFHLLAAKALNITNIALLCTDATLLLNNLVSNSVYLSEKNRLFYALGSWTEHKDERSLKIKTTTEILQAKYNYVVPDNITVYDAAARLFVLENVEMVSNLFNIWNDVITTLYLENKIMVYNGWVMINDEFILAQVYNLLGIEGSRHNPTVFNIKHDAPKERFWAA